MFNSYKIDQEQEVKTDQYKNVTLRKVLVDDINDGHDTSTDLLRGVAMIISAHPQHNHLDMEEKTSDILNMFCI